MIFLFIFAARVFLRGVFRERITRVPLRGIVSKGERLHSARIFLDIACRGEKDHSTRGQKSSACAFFTAWSSKNVVGLPFRWHGFKGKATRLDARIFAERILGII